MKMGPRFLVYLFLTAAMASPAAAAELCGDQAVVDTGRENGGKFEKVKIKADNIDFPKRNQVLLRGYTQLIRGGHRVYADELLYNKTRNEVEASGVVKLETPKGDVVKTSVLTYDITNGVAVSGPATFVVADRQSELLGSGKSTVNAHGEAERITFESEYIMILENAQVTTCLDGEEDVTFKADELRVDLNEGVRTGKRVKIKIAEPNKHKRMRELMN